LHFVCNLLLPDHYYILSGSASSQATVVKMLLFDSIFKGRLIDEKNPAI
jgi:hypothetical protein